jgi:hypothetical protein
MAIAHFAKRRNQTADELVALAAYGNPATAVVSDPKLPQPRASRLGALSQCASQDLPALGGRMPQKAEMCGHRPPLTYKERILDFWLNRKASLEKGNLKKPNKAGGIGACHDESNYAYFLRGNLVAQVAQTLPISTLS